MPKPRPSVTKRQREQKKRDRQLEKEERRAVRKTEGGGPEIDMTEMVREQSEQAE